MKRVLFCFLLSLCILKANAQVAGDDNSNIKLFVYKTGIRLDNPKLDSSQCEHLFIKTQQLINETGVAELGYSTFLVAPKFNFLSESTDQTGISTIYMEECELSISIERRTVDGHGGASFKSFTKTIIGSGSSYERAKSNAINSIKGTDPQIVNFLNNAKQTIANYFNTHCKDVLDEANQALSLKNYAQAIALYYSVPTKAPCYEEARQRSIGVYTTYVDDNCEKQLTKLKAYVAMGLNNDDYYKKAIDIMEDLGPTAKCYQEALTEINKLEARFTEEQKQMWDLHKANEKGSIEAKKEMYKAIGRISSSYQPSVDRTVIISH